MKRLSLLAALLATAGIGFQLLLAQPPTGPERPRSGPGGGVGGPGFGSPPNPLLDLLDKDKDGELSAAEIDGVAESLRSLDKNKDDQVTANELPIPQGGPGFGGRGGPDGPGRGGERKLVEEFDANEDGRLDRAERDAARKSIAQGGGSSFGRGRRGPGGPGGPGGRRGGRPGGPGGGDQNTPKPGPHVEPGDVTSFPDRPLYDESIVRTLFFEFEADDWEAEMADFYRTDVEVPAKLTVDGKTYPDVGVAFRGNSSFFSLSSGQKRSFNLRMDYADKDQHLYGYRTLNLLNGHADASFLRTVLYNHIARQYVPAPKSNFVRVVVNGESWGVYVNDQQFNKDFADEWFAERDGVRWKMPAGGGSRSLNFSGPEKQAYASYQLKSSDNEQAWTDLIELCRLLEQTPVEEIDTALDSTLNIDRVLWFLAVDNVLLDMDGYHSRGSDYVMYQDTRHGRFHVLPYDSNEVFRNAGGGHGPGGGGPGGGRRRGPGFGGFGLPGFGPPGDAPPASEQTEDGGPFGLDPLAGSSNASRPLLHKLLANPRVKARYLAHVKTIADNWLDWKTIGPLIEQMHALIDADVKADTRRLYSYDAFVASTGDFAGAGRSAPGFRAFIEGRRKYLSSHKLLGTQPEFGEVNCKPEGLSRAEPITSKHDVVVSAEMEKKSRDCRLALHYSWDRNAAYVSVAMLDDGKHGDGAANDGRFAALIPKRPAGTQVVYYVEAIDAQGVAAFHPPRAEAAPHRFAVESMGGPIKLVISEVMPGNKSKGADANGEFDDWIEIANLSAEAVDLSGCFLTDSKRRLRKWAFPSGTVIDPGAFLVIWADNDLEQAGLHANFKLSQSGETVYLVDSNPKSTTIIDQVEWRNLRPDVAYGRLRDGKQWSSMTPTPGGPNAK
jgi:hypothetical protein